MVRNVLENSRRFFITLCALVANIRHDVQLDGAWECGVKFWRTETSTKAPSDVRREAGAALFCNCYVFASLVGCCCKIVDQSNAIRRCLLLLGLHFWNNTSPVASKGCASYCAANEQAAR
jgi:hypothetical protein